jgi:capsule biosynthesis phosphatase
MNRKIVMDLDNTLTLHDPSIAYSEMLPNISVIKQLRRYSAEGYEIIIFTARGMKSYNEDIDAIRKHRLPVILNWLEKHSVPFDEVRIGKPYCGEKGFYVDDKAIRPNEFVNLSITEVQKLIT